MPNHVNVLLIAIDTLRADHMSCYSYRKRTTPYIDEIVKEGVIFETCIAPGIPTHPGYTTIMTGVHPLTHQIVCHAGKVALRPDIKTLPEILRIQGYITAAVDNLALAAPWFLRGYEYYFYSGGITVISKGVKVTGRVVTEKALAFLNTWKRGTFGDRPFFLFVHYWDPHTPYLPPSELIEKFYNGRGVPLKPLLEQTKWGRHILKHWLRELIEKGHDDKNYIDASYDAEVCYADVNVSKLVYSLKDIGEYDNTLIVITSDHGEGLGENKVYYDHHGLYEWDIRVPLIMRLPDKFPKGVEVKGIVTHEDIVPTILDLVGIKLKYSFDGKSLLPLVKGEEKGKEFVVCVENTRMTKRAIRTEEWKLIQTLRPDIYGNPAGHVELYDLKVGEHENLASENLDLVKDLLFAMEAWYREKLNGRPDPLATQEISLPLED